MALSPRGRKRSSRPTVSYAAETSIHKRDLPSRRPRACAGAQGVRWPWTSVASVAVASKIIRSRRSARLAANGALAVPAANPARNALLSGARLAQTSRKLVPCRSPAIHRLWRARISARAAHCCAACAWYPRSLDRRARSVRVSDGAFRGAANAVHMRDISQRG